MKLYIAFLLIAAVSAQGFGIGAPRPNNAGRQGRRQGGPPASAPAAAPAPNPFKAVSRFQPPGLSGTQGFQAPGFQALGFQAPGRNNFIMPGYRSGATNPYGTKVYGMGINNRFARPHSIFEVQRAEKVANNNPNILVRINPDGDVELTDRYGMEVEDLYNAYGMNIADF